LGKVPRKTDTKKQTQMKQSQQTLQEETKEDNEKSDTEKVSQSKITRASNKSKMKKSTKNIEQQPQTPSKTTPTQIDVYSPVLDSKKKSTSWPALKKDDKTECISEAKSILQTIKQDLKNKTLTQEEYHAHLQNVVNYFENIIDLTQDENEKESDSEKGEETETEETSGDKCHQDEEKEKEKEN